MLSITIHNCKAVRAVHTAGERSSWVDLTFVDGRGRDFELAVFFQNDLIAKRFADSVNATAEVAS